MPGYGIVGPTEGTGLLPWQWATDRLTRSHDYWIATVWPDGRPHVTPVWGVWRDDALWFSCSRRSRKARNLEANPVAVATTDDPANPVIVEGEVAQVLERDPLLRSPSGATPSTKRIMASSSLATPTTRVSGSR